MMTPDNIRNAGLTFVAFLFSICFHEMAHAWMAKRRGDRTAELMGRLTMNPVAHADIIGTVLLPILGSVLGGGIFGWAKPVPVNSRNLKHPVQDMFWIALAGPGSNLLLAFLSVVVLVLCFRFNVDSPVAFSLLKPMIAVNLLLCFFNLIPLHPLDGGKILARFLPYELNRKLEDAQTFSMIVLLILFATRLISFINYPVQWSYGAMLHVAQAVLL